jgi:2'-5' RNA ligase
MPANIIASFATKSGKSKKEVEALWDTAKASADKQGHKEDYQYITGILKKMLKIEDRKLERFKNYIFEREQEYGIALIRPPGYIASQILDFAFRITRDELYQEADEYGSYGVEDEPHITLRYGCLCSDPDEITDMIYHLPINITLGTTSFFSSEKYDILKLSVNSPDLHNANKAIGDLIDFPGETFAEYKPHLTLAYLKKGYIAKYLNDSTFEGMKFDAQEIYLIDPEDNEYKITKQEY